MNAAAPGILEDFIASEDEALVHCKQGDFYLPNHHLIKPLVFTAETLLNDASRQRLYFHLLRVGELPPAKNAADFSMLLAAYEATAPLLAQGFPLCSLQRALGLLAFGYDDRGALRDEPPPDVDSYRRYVAVWAQCNAHTAIPYMIDKANQFSLYAADAALVTRIVKLLRHINYIHTDVSPQLEARYPVTRLWFWALVFIALLNADTAAAVVESFRAPTIKLPRHPEQLKILGRYVDAVGRPDLKERLAMPAGAKR